MAPGKLEQASVLVCWQFVGGRGRCCDAGGQGPGIPPGLRRVQLGIWRHLVGDAAQSMENGKTNTYSSAVISKMCRYFQSCEWDWMHGLLRRSS